MLEISVDFEPDSTAVTRAFVRLFHDVYLRQHFRQNGQADLVRRFEVYDKFKFRCLLHRQIKQRISLCLSPRYSIAIDPTVGSSL